MKTVKTLVISLAILALGGAGFVYSGLFNVSAMQQDGPLLAWLLHTTMRQSAELRARNIRVPELDGRELILAGLSDYNDMCAGCHGEPGSKPGYIGQGLNPPPPGLSRLAKRWNAAEQFWIINNGVRMTGMPAFGRTHGPDDIWPVVAFLQAAGDMTAEEYRRLKSAAEGHGHHAAGANNESGDTDPHAQDNHDDAAGSGDSNHPDTSNPGSSKADSRESDESQGGGHDHSSHEHTH